MGEEWALYEQLLDLVPADARVRSCLIGRVWTLVESQAVGMAMTSAESDLESHLHRPLAGRTLRDLAGYLTSWDLSEAALGLAALNAHINAPAQVETWLGSDLRRFRAASAFEAMGPELVGKKVAVVGHFPGLASLRERCDLTVFERRPQLGDLPDFAEDYLLPHQDVVFITGATLTNKTLPHLLEVSRRSRVVLVGPSVPLTPLWFEWGVDTLAGCVVTDGGKLWQMAQEGAGREVFGNGTLTIQVRADQACSPRNI